MFETFLMFHINFLIKETPNLMIRLISLFMFVNIVITVNEFVEMRCILSTYMKKVYNDIQVLLKQYSIKIY